jgi:hypothetical protein
MAIAGIPQLGGSMANAAISDADRALFTSMWADVRNRLDHTYSTASFHVAQLLTAQPTLSTAVAAHSTSLVTGEITFSLQVKVSKAEWYAAMVAEAYRSIAVKSHLSDGGAAWKVPGDSAGRQELTALLQSIAVPNWGLQRLADYASQVRSFGRTAATLAVELRDSCGANEPDSNDFAKATAAQWGVPAGTVLDGSSQRAHYGTQYLGFLWGDVDFSWKLRGLQTTLRRPELTAFRLLSCGFTQPPTDAAAQQRLTACLSH